MLRVKDLQDILVALHQPKSGRKDDLLRRLRDACRSSVMVYSAGGKERVERVINTAYNRMAGRGLHVSTFQLKLSRV